MTGAGILDAGGTGLVVAVLVWCALRPWRSVGLLRARAVGVHDAPRTWRSRGRPVASAPPVQLAVVLDLLGAALGAGCGVPRALAATGHALGGDDGATLRAVGSALLLGADWDAAWGTAPARLRPLAEALRAAWTHGAAPRDALRVAGAQVTADARARARTAAGRLGVHLVLPLGTCFLPAFVLIGLVPVLVSLGSGVLG